MGRATPVAPASKVVSKRARISAGRSSSQASVSATERWAVVVKMGNKHSMRCGGPNDDRYTVLERAVVQSDLTAPPPIDCSFESQPTTCVTVGL